MQRVQGNPDGRVGMMCATNIQDIVRLGASSLREVPLAIFRTLSPGTRNNPTQCFLQYSPYSTSSDGDLEFYLPL